ncbi:MAG: prephenate dehydrogenase [Planctomycetota bacterium]
MKDLRQITVVGAGLLGSSITLGISRCFRGVKTICYAHRAVTRRKARELAVATEISGDLKGSVAEADIVILATPVFAFEQMFEGMADVLSSGCVVTDVGSTKALPHRWASRRLPKRVHYVGSHPIAGSEHRGVEYARDDLFDGALCILTTTKSTNRSAVGILRKFWTALGCRVESMSPGEHDRVFANVSHLPHVAAAALMNCSKADELDYVGKGFMDTSRIASGPANIWSDVLLANAGNVTRSIDRMVAELLKLKSAAGEGNRKEIEKLLKAAREKRAALVRRKIKKKEMMS